MDQSPKKTEQGKKRRKASCSQNAMQQSMVRLMKSVPYSDITVTMIANDACINRKTFYAHYPTKEKLLFAMLYEMFDDLFSSFLYKKDPPVDVPDAAKLKEDAQIFLRKLICYEERLQALLTDETLGFSLSVADQVVLNCWKDIAFLNETGDTIFQKLYVKMIRGFFMSLISAWMDLEKKSFDENVDVLVRIMKHSYADLFSYTKATPES